MKILITGATGFVGSHLCDLLDQEEHEIYSLVRDPDKAKKFQVKGKYIQGSLNPSKTHNWVAELPIDLDAVVHTAGIVHSFDNKSFFTVNTESTRQLIEDLSFKYPKLKFVFISSLAAAGPSAQHQNEEQESLPVSDYGRSKLIAETILKSEAPSDWQKTIIRPPMVIGPRDPAIVDVFKMVKNGFVPSLGFKGGKKAYSFVSVFDLVETINLSLKDSSTQTEVFYSSHPNSINFESLLRVMAKRMGVKPPRILPIPVAPVRFALKLWGITNPKSLRLTPDKINEIVPMAWTCSGKKSSEKLGQVYKWDIETTIDSTLEDYKKRNWI